MKARWSAKAGVTMVRIEGNRSEKPPKKGVQFDVEGELVTVGRRVDFYRDRNTREWVGGYRPRSYVSRTKSKEDEQ